MIVGDEFEAVRREGDPILQARHATELLAIYQQRSTELARLRRDAIERAAAELGLSFTAVAAKIGLSKGRITQIRQTAPPSERGFFGVGPITVAVPVRASADRPGGVIALEDQTAAERLTDLLASLSFAVESAQIPPSGEWTPPAEAIVICGPKSSPVTARAIAADPYLSYEADKRGRWLIRDRATGETFRSPIDDGETGTDIAYVARLPHDDGSLFVIAGVHALGSLGAVEYLHEHLAALWADVGAEPFSMIVESRFDGTTAEEVRTAWGPKRHT